MDDYFHKSHTISFSFLSFCIYFWEKESVHMPGRGRERERERENPKQAPRGGAWTHEPSHHDLSQSRTLNQRNHPGAPVTHDFCLVPLPSPSLLTPAFRKLSNWLYLTGSSFYLPATPSCSILVSSVSTGCHLPGFSHWEGTKRCRSHFCRGCLLIVLHSFLGSSCMGHSWPPDPDQYLEPQAPVN